MAVEDILIWFSNFFSALVFVAPGFQFYNVIKGYSDYEDTPIISIVIAYCNCLVWYTYGKLIFCDPIKICNIIGSISSLVFIIIYLVYELKKFFTDALLNAGIILTGTWATYRFLTMVLTDPFILGKLCIITSLISLLHPFYLIYKVIKEKNYRFISMGLNFITFLSGVLWSYFGHLRRNDYIKLANSMIIYVAALQFIVYRIYKRKYPTPCIELPAETSTIGIESTGDKIEEEDKDEEDVKFKTQTVKIVTKKNTSINN